MCIRDRYEEQQAAAIDLVPEKEVSYKIGDEVVVDLPTLSLIPVSYTHLCLAHGQ